MDEERCMKRGKKMGVRMCGRKGNMKLSMGRAKQIENATPIWHHSVVGEATWYKLELLV